MYYKQTGGIAMGSRLGPNYAHLFMGHVEEQIFNQYMGPTPALFKRYINDIAGATSDTREEIEDFANFANGFHSNLIFSWSISDEQLPFLDLCLKQTSGRLVNTIHYKETGTHTSTAHLRTPLVVRILSLTVSFSAYDASAATRGILRSRAKK